jgi:hypothetical protein
MQMRSSDAARLARTLPAQKERSRRQEFLELCQANEIAFHIISRTRRSRPESLATTLTAFGTLMMPISGALMRRNSRNLSIVWSSLNRARRGHAKRMGKKRSIRESASYRAGAVLLCVRYCGGHVRDYRECRHFDFTRVQMHSEMEWALTARRGALRRVVGWNTRQLLPYRNRIGTSILSI